MDFIKRNSPVLQAVLLLLVVMFTGIGVMVWIAFVSADELTPAAAKLTDIADGMVKISVGAILGVVGAAAASRNGG